MCNGRLQMPRSTNNNNQARKSAIHPRLGVEKYTMSWRTLFDNVKNWKQGQQKNRKMLDVWITANRETLSACHRRNSQTLAKILITSPQKETIITNTSKSFFTGYKMTNSCISGGVCSWITITSAHIILLLFKILTFLFITSKNNANEHPENHLSQPKTMEDTVQWKNKNKNPV